MTRAVAKPGVNDHSGVLVIVDNSGDGVSVSGDPGWILLLHNQV